MNVIKITATIFNILMIWLIIVFEKKFTWSKDKACIIGFGFMEITYLLNTFCIWF